jgi:hypothetical protein
MAWAPVTAALPRETAIAVGSRRHRRRLHVSVKLGEIERRLVAYGDDAGLVVVIRTGMTAALHFHGLGGHRSPVIM